MATALVVLTAGDAQSQGARTGDRVTILSGTSLRSGAGGDRVAVTAGELRAVVDQTAASFVRVTLEGHVRARDLQLVRNRSRADVRPEGGTFLREGASTSARAVASLRQGTTLYPERVGAQFPSGDAWLRVRRAFWVDVSRLKAPVVAAGKTSPAAATRSAPAAASERSAAPRPADARPSDARSARATEPDAPVRIADSASGRLAPDAADDPARSASGAPRGTGASASGAPLRVAGSGGAQLRAGPDGAVIATLDGAAPLSTLGRENGWVRVRLDGWLPDSAVTVPGPADASAITAAELRANPEAHRGRLVRWTVEVLAFQTADALRVGLAPEEPYLLARGPDDERAVLYLAVPPELVAGARALPALARIAVTARVRDGRSRPSGVPILELLDLERR